MAAGLILGDTGGPLIWPMMAFFFGFVGLLIGWGARSDWQVAVVIPTDLSRRAAKVVVPLPARWIAVGMIALGGGFLLDASRLPRIRDEALYQERYDRLGLHREDTDKFHRLRQEFLTGKTRSEDYGATLLICGMMIPVIFMWRGRRRELLQTRGSVFFIRSADFNGFSIVVGRGCFSGRRPRRVSVVGGFNWHSTAGTAGRFYFYANLGDRTFIPDRQTAGAGQGSGLPANQGLAIPPTGRCGMLSRVGGAEW